MVFCLTKSKKNATTLNLDIHILAGMLVQLLTTTPTAIRQRAVRQAVLPQLLLIKLCTTLNVRLNLDG